MTQMEPTFAQQDQLEAERRAKRVEVVERLSKILAKEFSLNELRFAQHFQGGSIVNESFEIARSKAR
jgi:hypothetical protein